MGRGLGHLPSVSSIPGSQRASYPSNLEERQYEQGTIANISLSILRRDRKHRSIVEV